MIETHTRMEHDSSDVWVEAAYRVQSGEIALYSVRIPYIDTQGPDAAAKLEKAKARAAHMLFRMVNALRNS